MNPLRMFMPVLFLLSLFVTAAALDEFSIEDNGIANTLMHDFPDHCYVMIETWIDKIRFECNNGVVAERIDGNRHILILQPDIKHTITVSAPGFKNDILMIPVLEPKLGVRYVIGKKAGEPVGIGSLNVSAAPDSAVVTIEGFGVSHMAPYRFKDLRSGPYIISVTKDYYKPARFPVVIGNGVLKDTAVTLERGDTDLAVISRPEGAEVFIDGEKRGTTPFAVASSTLGLAPGKHRLSLSRYNYDEIKKEFTLKTDGVTKLEYPLTCKTSLTVRSSPSGAEVVIDSVARGTTPLEKTPIDTGLHLIVLRKAGFADRSDTVRIRLFQSREKSYTMASGNKVKRLEAIKSNLSPFDDQSTGECRGLLATSVEILRMPGIGAIEPGIAYKVPLLLRLTVKGDGERSRVSGLFGVSFMGDVIVHPQFFILDMVGIHMGMCVQNKSLTSRLYAEIYTGINMGETNLSYSNSSGSAYVSSGNIWAPVTGLIRYEYTFLPFFSFVFEGGIWYLSSKYLWEKPGNGLSGSTEYYTDDEAKASGLPTGKLSGFVPYAGAGIRLHLGLIKKLIHM